jgi:hypothetical protein
LNNGSELATLEATFADCDYTFRHFADCRFSCMRWQCGRNVADTVTFADGNCYLVERFELLAWSETSEGLIDKLS